MHPGPPGTGMGQMDVSFLIVLSSFYVMYDIIV